MVLTQREKISVNKCEFFCIENTSIHKYSLKISQMVKLRGFDKGISPDTL